MELNFSTIQFLYRFLSGGYVTAIGNKKECNHLLLYIIYSIFFAVILCGIGCTPQKVVIKSEPPAEARNGKKFPEHDVKRPSNGEGDALFDEAEKAFMDHAYDKAVVLYQQYADHYLDREKAPAALMKAGALMSAGGRYDEAISFYERLIKEYPDHAYRHEARYQILANLYKQGKYHELIEEAEKDPDTGADPLRRLSLLGAASEKISDYVSAATYYYEGHELEKAMGETTFYNHMDTVLNKLSSDDIRIVLSRVDDPLIKSRLMFHLAKRLADESKYDKAVEVLNDFADRYENDENVVEARKMIREFSNRTEFEPYTIGILLPLSGRYEPVGKKAMQGIEMAVMDFGMKTGPDGAPLQARIVVKDSGGDPEKAAAAVEELDQEKVAAIIGPLAVAEQAAQEAQKRMIPMIALSQKKGIPQIGDYIFRNFITPEMQVNSLVRFAISDLGVKHFAILYPNESYGQTFMNMFWDKVAQTGGEVVGAEAYDPAGTDFAGPIKKLVGLYHNIPDRLRPQPKKINPHGKPEPEAIVDFGAIFIPDSPAKAGLIIPQLAYYDVSKVYLLGTNLWNSDSLIKMAGDYAQGAVLTDGFFKGSQNPHVADFVSRFSEIYGEKPGFIEAVAYDSAMMLFEILNREETRFRGSVVEELLHVKEFDGVTGKTSFAADGEPIKDLFMLQVRNDAFVEIR